MGNLFPKNVIAGARYAVLAYNLRGYFIAEHWDDIISTAYMESFPHHAMKDAKNAASRYIYNQICHCGMVSTTISNREAWRENIDDCNIPVLALARILKSKKYGGKRARHGAALKALIMRDKANGETFRLIGAKYNISIDNAKEHYKHGWKIMRKWLARRVTMLSPDQRKLFQESLFKQGQQMYRKGNRNVDL